ncbi:MAG: amidase domain-containing protein [Firmicutes bacterium]|nr:amidase domain-containing protein [[Eubacterium] siraeum]MCM1487913.1 amidase domain-containing protein [Bacillota bacterium]
MKKRIILISIGIIAVITAISALLFFDPFREIFDKIFQKQENNGEVSENYQRKWYGWDQGEELDRIQAILNRYFDCFYSPAAKESSAENIEELFADSCADCIYDMAALKSVLYRQENSSLDYGVRLSTLHLWLINTVEINKNGYIIMVDQSSERNYGNIPDYLCGEGVYSHTFIFERTGGKWYITAHSCEKGAWRYGKNKMNSLCGSESPSYLQLYNCYPYFCSALEENFEKTKELIALNNYPTPYTADTVYNRQKAVEYAQRWCSPVTESRNINRWKDYDDDSMNFVSQCIFEGIGKMDTKGDLIWKWFDDKIEYYYEDSGRSMSWIEGENFWYYVTSNQRRGLSAMTDVGGGQLEQGDIVQLMLREQPFSQVIITEVLYDDKGNKADFLVCGHDDELLNFPLSMLNYDSIRPIRILGYNED